MVPTRVLALALERLRQGSYRRFRTRLDWELQLNWITEPNFVKKTKNLWRRLGPAIGSDKSRSKA